VDSRRAWFAENRRLDVEAAPKVFLLTPEEAEKNWPDIIEIKEAYLPVDDVTFDDGSDCTTGGYADHGFVCHRRKYAEWIDWKFGAWPVAPAKDNLQGIAYVLGIFKKFPTVDNVKFTFKQPHRAHF
jgi:hypothetical protein